MGLPIALLENPIPVPVRSAAPAAAIYATAPSQPTIYATAPADPGSNPPCHWQSLGDLRHAADIDTDIEMLPSPIDDAMDSQMESNEATHDDDSMMSDDSDTLRSFPIDTDPDPDAWLNYIDFPLDGTLEAGSAFQTGPAPMIPEHAMSQLDELAAALASVEEVVGDALLSDLEDALLRGEELEDVLPRVLDVMLERRDAVEEDVARAMDQFARGLVPTSTGTWYGGWDTLDFDAMAVQLRLQRAP